MSGSLEHEPPFDVPQLSSHSQGMIESRSREGNSCNKAVAEKAAVIDDTIRRRTAKAKDAYLLSMAHSEAATLHQIRVGLELLAIREEYAYGEWLAYVSREWPTVSIRTLQRYQSLARRWEKLRQSLAKQLPQKTTELSHSEPEKFVELIENGGTFDIRTALADLKNGKKRKRKAVKGEGKPNRVILHPSIANALSNCTEWEGEAFSTTLAPRSKEDTSDIADNRLELSKPWRGKVFVVLDTQCDLSAWITKTLQEFNAARVDEAIVVLPADFRIAEIDALLEFPIVVCRCAAREAPTSSGGLIKPPTMVVFLSEHPNLTAISAAFKAIGHVLRPAT